MNYRRNIVALLLIFSMCYILSCNNQTMSNNLQRVFYQSFYIAEPGQLVKQAAFSPDGSYFYAYGENSHLYIWRVDDFSLYKIIKLIPASFFDSSKKDDSIKYYGKIVGAYFIPNSNSIFVGFYNGAGINIEINTDKKSIITFLEDNDTTESTAVSRSGNILAMGTSYYDRIMKKLKKNSIVTQTGLLITNNDKYLIAGVSHGHVLHIIDISTGKKTIYRPEIPAHSIHGTQMTSVAVSPDNDTVAFGLDNGQIRIYSIRSGKETGILKHGGSWATAWFVPDGKLLVTCSDNNNKMVFWNTSDWTKKYELKAPEGASTATWFQKGKSLAFGTESGDLVIKDISTGGTVLKQHVTDAAILSVDYLPSKHLFLFCDFNRGISVYKMKL